MHEFWYLAILVVLLLALLLFSKIRIDVYFSRKSHDDKLTIKTRALFGLVHFKYEIPVIYWNNFKKGFTIKKETINLNQQSLKAEGKAKINRETIMEKFELFKVMLMNTVGLHKWMLSTMARMRCTELSWETRVGLGDAPDTAITTGMIWGAKSSLIGYIFNHIRLVSTPRLSVIPLFNEEHFETLFRCKLHIRLGVALLAGILLLPRVLKVKGGLRVWRNILTRA